MVANPRSIPFSQTSLQNVKVQQNGLVISERGRRHSNLDHSGH